MESKVVLSVTFVLAGVELLTTPDQINEFGKTGGFEEIVVGTTAEGIMLGPPTAVSRSIELGPQQTEVLTQDGRTSVRKNYPATTGDIDSLVQIIEAAVNASAFEQDKVVALGYNTEVAYTPPTQELAPSYIGRRVLSKEIRHTINKERWGLISLSSNVGFVGLDGEAYNITIEPRLKEAGARRVFLGVNHHVPSSLVPSPDEIRAALVDIWETADMFIANLNNIPKE